MNPLQATAILYLGSEETKIILFSLLACLEFQENFVELNKSVSVSTVMVRLSTEVLSQSKQTKIMPKSGTGKKPKKRKSVSKNDPAPVACHDLPACKGCGRLVSDDVHALGCDGCLDDDQWMCVQCLGITDEIYDSLSTPGGLRLKWFCKECERKMEEGTVDKSDTILKLLEQLVEGSKTFDERLTKFENSLNNKVDAERVNNIEVRIDKMDSI